MRVEKGLRGAGLGVGSDALARFVEAHRAPGRKALGNVAAHLNQEIDTAILAALCDELSAERVGKADG